MTIESVPFNQFTSFFTEFQSLPADDSSKVNQHLSSLLLSLFDDKSTDVQTKIKALRKEVFINPEVRAKLELALRSQESASRAFLDLARLFEQKDYYRISCYFNDVKTRTFKIYESETHPKTPDELVTALATCPSQEDVLKLVHQVGISKIVSTVSNLISQVVASKIKLISPSSHVFEKIHLFATNELSRMYSDERFLNFIVGAYQRHFIKSDLYELLHFYESDTGRRFVQAWPKMVEECVPILLSELRRDHSAAAAEPKPAQTAGVSVDRPTTNGTIKRLFEVLRMNDMIASMKTMIEKDIAEKVSSENRARVLEDFQRFFKELNLIEKIAPFYQKYFSQDDAEIVIAFYERPVSQRFLTNMMNMMEDSKDWLEYTVQLGQAFDKKLDRFIEEIKSQESQASVIGSL